MATKLPNEILVEIISLAANIGPFRDNIAPCRGQLFTLMLVCHQWRIVAESLLYHKLVVGKELYEYLIEEHRDIHGSGKSDRCLIRSLKENPELGRHTRILEIHPRENDAAQLARQIDLVRQCSGTNEPILRLHRVLKPLPLLEEIPKLSLRKVTLSSVGAGISANAIFEFFDSPTLERMNILRLGYNIHGNWEPYAEWNQGVPSAQDLDHLLPPHRWRTSSLKILSLQHSIAHPHVIGRLLLWPALLEEFRFTYIDQTEFQDDYSLTEIEGFLHLHRDSLKRIQLGNLPEYGIPDFSLFSHLEQLWLFLYDLMKENTSSACRKLAAPNLRRLVIDCSHENHYPDGDCDFGPHHLKWLKEFLSDLGSSDPSHNLKTVHVYFKPLCRWNTEGPFRRWPGELLQEAAETASSYGISLTYSKPIMRKDEWYFRVGIIPDNRKKRMMTSAECFFGFEYSMGLTQWE
ncbi:hypothetical protein AJ80_04933 [Polytolypa hystricis UAMH7299]|uniref:F-box domain-containing protein n=1 Tax=Polytolypa hystricis (strain UAMH7299) TaxID=1447883 RepID=A0A2B7XZJ2_POLH7|nr:hypothetical protein AJ80_04933 [Polytolypa hystricis UAMH7299]